MEELIRAMSITELQVFKKTYIANPAIVKIIDGYIEVKTKEEAQAKAKAEFGKAIEKLIAKLPHPEDVTNVYLAWREVEEVDTTKPAVEVEVVKVVGQPAVKEMRQPTIKSIKWVVEVNKGFQVSKSGTSTTPATSKRAITVFKRDGTQLTLVGHFPSGSKACSYLKLDEGVSSAPLTLRNNGYVVEAMETGTTYTAS